MSYGAQVGVTDGPKLAVGQEVELALRPRLFQKDFVLNLAPELKPVWHDW